MCLSFKNGTFIFPFSYPFTNSSIWSISCKSINPQTSLLQILMRLDFEMDFVIQLNYIYAQVSAQTHPTLMRHWFNLRNAGVLKKPSWCSHCKCSSLKARPLELCQCVSSSNNKGTMPIVTVNLDTQLCSLNKPWVFLFSGCNVAKGLPSGFCTHNHNHTWYHWLLMFSLNLSL